MSIIKKRQTIIILLFLTLYVVVILRLFYWQVVRGDEFKKIGMLQSSDSIVLQAIRGDILTSDSFPIATNKLSYWLYANPKMIGDKQYYAQKIAPIIGEDVATVSAELNQNLFWVSLARGIDSKTKAKLDALNLNGIGFEKESSRLYPEASLAAQLIGFVGKDSNDQPEGYFGLEGYYNELLKGRNGEMYVIKDALGNPVLSDIRQEPKIDGGTIQLTIDRTIQFITEQQLLAGIRKYDGTGGTAIVMDPNTGKVLAMASFPDFNPQSYWNFNPSSYKNPAISMLYEPGSTFKVLVMAAAIDQHLLTPQTRCNICGGPVQIGKYAIHTWNNQYFPNTTMEAVIQHSDNTGMVFVARKLGVQRMLQYFKRFGIDRTTGIDLQGEVAGDIRPAQDWYPIDLATAGFGQGVSVTPIQLLNAVNSIANGGKIMRPYVVQKIYTSDGKTVTIQPKVVRQAISESTSQVMTWVMYNAAQHGDSAFVNIKGLEVAGKTGTAQIPVDGHYDPNQTIASFIGFFPVTKPKISMLIIVDKPQNAIYGSETAAPIFYNIAKQLVNYLNIPLSY